MNDNSMKMIRKYVYETLSRSEQIYPDELVAEMLIESHKSLMKTQKKVNRAKREYKLGKFLLKYLEIL